MCLAFADAWKKASAQFLCTGPGRRWPVQGLSHFGNADGLENYFRLSHSRLKLPDTSFSFDGVPTTW